jgi:hypothetical protein
MGIHINYAVKISGILKIQNFKLYHGMGKDGLNLICKRSATDRRSNCAQDQENNLDYTGVVTNLRSQCPEGHGDETERRRQGVPTSRERIDYFRGELSSADNL